MPIRLGFMVTTAAQLAWRYHDVAPPSLALSRDPPACSRSCSSTARSAGVRTTSTILYNAAGPTGDVSRWERALKAGAHASRLSPAGTRWRRLGDLIPRFARSPLTLPTVPSTMLATLAHAAAAVSRQPDCPDTPPPCPSFTAGSRHRPMRKGVSYTLCAAKKAVSAWRSTTSFSTSSFANASSTLRFSVSVV